MTLGNRQRLQLWAFTHLLACHYLRATLADIVPHGSIVERPGEIFKFAPAVLLPALELTVLSAH